MKLKYCVAALSMGAAFSASAQDVVNSDSIFARWDMELSEAEVVATRATKTTPVAFKTISKEQIQEMNFGKDIPCLLAMTPSVTFSSDAGNGIGYTGIHVRGTDPSRINITTNGIPMNDGESNQVYWVNIGDLASSLASMQIQRGVGTSTNGSGAFGATVNLQTDILGMEPFTDFDVSAGTYGSHKETVRFGTGMLNNHFALQGRLSNIGSDGYLDRASTRLGSYFLQGAYMNNNTVVKFVTFNGQERTYHAWNYTSKYEQSLYGRTYNSCGEYYDEAGNVHYYDNQIDKYHQQHYQLFWDQRLSSTWNYNLGLHYTKGQGYYEEYKTNRKLAEYNLQPIVLPEYDEQGALVGTQTLKKSDLIRRKQMDNDFYGFVTSLNFNNKNGLTSNIGGGWNQYDGDHFGNVLWVKNYTASLAPDFEYYNNNAKKQDANIYAKVNWEFLKGLSVFGDVQYRYVHLTMKGLSDDFDANGQVNFDEKHSYNFFNPKAGLNYQINAANRAYASVAVAHKEPTRNDYEDNIGANLKAERLIDFEAGYQYSTPSLSLGANFYYMHYNNQFVLTGQLNEIGEMIASNDNSGKSYRTGIELEGAWQPVKWFRWDANATFSRNRNKNWTVNLTQEGTWDSQGSCSLGDTPISFSPDVIFNNFFTFTYKGFRGSLQSQYVGKQYLTNTGMKSFIYDNKDYSMMLDAFFTTNLDLAYKFDLSKCRSWVMKSATLGVTVYNLFSEQYDNNGWAYAEIGKNGDGYVYAWSTDEYEAGFAPQAPCHFMAHLTLSF